MERCRRRPGSSQPEAAKRQQLEVTVGELLPDQSVPLLKRRLELSREEALKLWAEKRQQGWQITEPLWHPPQLPANG